MACPKQQVITARLTAPCNADQQKVFGELGENWLALAVQHCTDAASEAGCVIVRVEPLAGSPMKEKWGGDANKCVYEFKAMVVCAKQKRSTWEIILDAVQKATGITLVLGVALLIPVVIAKDVLEGDEEPLENLAKVLDGVRKAIEVGAP